jgi:glucose-1-phosphate thymidylyltransferase
MWGIIPAAGRGTRIQPLAFSKELLPVGSRLIQGSERPRAVGDYLVERMLVAGVDRICFVIAPGKSDIVEHFGGETGAASICYAVQPQPVGLCDAIFRALPFIAPEDTVAIGLPDTIWFPVDGLARLPKDRLSFLLFPFLRPEFFDAVVASDDGEVQEIQVKRPGAESNWIWGAIQATGTILRELQELWEARGRGDEYIGTLVNAYLAKGGSAVGVRAGELYVDVGTLDGYRTAIRLLSQSAEQPSTPAWARS